MDKKNKTSLLYNQDKFYTEISGVSLLIPSEVKNRIDHTLKTQKIKFRKVTYEKAYYLAYIILKEQEQEELSVKDFFKPLAVSQYLKVGPPNGYFGERFYLNAFLPLSSHLPSTSAAKSDTNSTKGSFDNSVFQSDGEYSKDQGVTLFYRINPMLLGDKYTHVQLNNLIGDNELNQTYKVQLSHFYKTAYSLSLDSEAITSNLDTEISPITIKRHDMPKESKKVRVYMAVRNMNEMYNYHETPLPNKQYKKYRLNNRLYSLKNEVSLNYIIKICENYNEKNQKNFAVIIDNNVIHLQEDEEFKEYKKDILTKDLDRKVKKIQNKYFTASISNSNGRLHSNFTNLNNIALKYSKINGCFLSAFDL